MLRRALCLSLCLMAVAVCVRAQCPQLKISGPDSVAEGESITFFVDVKGGGADVQPTYNWTVSAGTISSGQGTSAIMVDTTGDGGTSVTATVEVGGYSAQCPNSKSTTVDVRIAVRARKIDEYGPVPRSDENSRLDNFAIELQNDPMAKAYVIAYGGPKSPATSAAARLRMVKTYLVQTRGIFTERIVTVNGGKRQKPGTELWVVPDGAKPPTASPTH